MENSPSIPPAQTRSARLATPLLRTLTAGTLAVLVAAGTFVAGDVAAAPRAEAAQSDIVQVSAATRASDQQRLLDAINQYRRSKGLKPVKFSRTLSAIEQPHADAQVRDENFYHTDQFMTDSRAGRWTHVNEIIALSYQRDVTQLLSWWKTSPAHNSAILSPRAEVIGIGLTYADGSLQRTGQPWRLLGSVNLYGYANGGAPADASTTVAGAGATTSVTAASAFTVRGGIGAAYKANGGAAVFGQPIMNEGRATGGQYQIFSKNGKRTKFLWSPSTGTHFVKEYGAIGITWQRRGLERGMGFPITNEYAYGNEIQQKFSNRYVVAWNIHTKLVRVYRY